MFLYAILKEVGKRSWKKALVSCRIFVEEFKENFEEVTTERYELESGRIRDADKGACDLRHTEKAREANKLMNEDEARMRYVSEACEELNEDV